MKDSFYKNSILLTLTNLLTGILKFVFAIFLSRQLGPEGMGLYGLIMPIYDLFCCLINGGMITAMSRECAQYSALGDHKNLKKTVHTALMFEIFWSVIMAFVMVMTSKLIAIYILKDIRAISSLRFISIAVIFVAVSSVLKGFYFGTAKAEIPASIDIIEKSIRIVAVTSLITFLQIISIEKAVTATYASLAIGEIISFTFLYLFYRMVISKHHQNTVHHREESSPQILYNIWSIALPLSINGFLTTAISSVSKLLIPARLASAGFTHGQALALIGKFSEMAMTIIFFPMIVIISVSIVLIPDLSRSATTKNYSKIEKRVKEVFTLAFLLGLCILVVCVTIPDELSYLLFKRHDIANYVKLVSLGAPLIYVSMTTYGILNGFGKQKIVLRNSIITALLQLLLCFLLIGVKWLNIYGYGIAMLVSSVVGLVINMHEINKHIYIDVNVGSLLLYILTAAFTYYIMKLQLILLPASFGAAKIVIILLSGILLFFSSSFVCAKKFN